MRIIKKSLACLLSVMLLLTCIPLSAAAAADGTGSLDANGGVEVVLTEIDSDSLANAIDAALNDV